MVDRVGQQLGNYRIVRLLGEGGFADVYLAEHIHLGIQAAIKILHTQLTSDDVEKFRKEARTIARLDHAHIIRVLDFGVEDKTPYLVMGYAANGNLRQCHPKGDILPLEIIVSYVKQVADALQYAHDRKLIHRDVKPDNMLLGEQNEVLLSDFGIAIVTQSSRHQSAHDMAGTIAYMAPEQLQGKPRPASDQYALGIVVYEWLTGDRPFHGSFTELYSQQLFVLPPSLSEKIPGITPAIDEVVLTALAKDPLQRFRKVQAFATALEQASQLTLKTSKEVVNVPAPSAPSVNSSSSDLLEQPTAPITSDALQEQLTVAITSDNLLEQPTAAISLDALRSHEINSSSLNDIQKQADKKLFLPSPTTGSADSSVLINASSPVVDQKTGRSPPSLAKVEASSINMVAKSEKSDKTTIAGPIHGSKKRLLTTILLIVLALLLVFFGVTYFVSGASPKTSVTIIPASVDLKNTYLLTAVTGKPDASQHQVQARLLSQSVLSQTKTVNASGVKIIPGVQAKGTLTFYNGSLRQITIRSGEIFMGQDGVQIAIDQPAIIPFAKPPTEGSVTVSAHAVNTGRSGNIHASDISMTCCIPGDFIYVMNSSAFTGGQDEQRYTFAQQSDIDNIVKPLIQSAKASFQNEIRSNEQLVNPAQCPSTVTSHPGVGEKAITVTVRITVTCRGEVFDWQAASSLVEGFLKEESSRNPGIGYVLAGKILSEVSRTTVDTKQTVSLLVNAEGIWLYQFSDAEKRELAKQIAGKSQNDAQALLKLTRVSKVTIQISGGDGNTLPADPNQITIIVQSIPGVQRTKTPTQ